METKTQAYEQELQQNTKFARTRALLALDDDNRAEVAVFEQARKLDNCGRDEWVARYQQALGLYNQIITAHGGQPVEVPAVD